jgi:hypothetical protein
MDSGRETDPADSEISLLVSCPRGSGHKSDAVDRRDEEIERSLLSVEKGVETP